jgi:(R,R)-butanediol dehydrogenase/meso-butanediol dehydrogenase/diacetyl reductase
MLMRALRWHGPHDLRLDEVADPEIAKPDDVLIEVAACGVCGTDLHEFAHGPNMIRPKPHPLTGVRAPLTLGHEFSGVVTATGSAVGDLEPGRLVTVDPCLRCGVCPPCLRGDYHLCVLGGSVGLASDGAFASHVVVPRVNVLPVPDGVSAEFAAVAEPLAVGLHAATRAQVGPGDAVLILGAGPIGIAALLGAVACGAASIYVSEPVAERARMAADFGATEVFDPTSTDVRREVFSRTGRSGPDAVIEATGRPDAFELAVTSVRRGGTVSVAGISAERVGVDLRQLVLYERQVVGSLGYHHDIERVLRLMAAGRLDAGPFVTAVAPLSNGVAVIEELAADRGGNLKVLLTPKG